MSNGHARIANPKRALFRLSVVFVVFWTTAWTLVYFDAKNREGEAEGLGSSFYDTQSMLFGRVPGGADSDPYYQQLDNDAREAFVERDRQRERASSAITFGLGGILAYLSLAAGLRWVWLGAIDASQQAPKASNTGRAVRNPTNSGTLSTDSDRDRTRMPWKRLLKVVAVMAFVAICVAVALQVGVPPQKIADSLGEAFFFALFAAVLSTAVWAWRAIKRS